MTVLFRKSALGGVVFGATRLSDGASFLVPKAGESEAPYLENPLYRSYKAALLDDPSSVADPAPPPTVYDGTIGSKARVRTTDAASTELYRAALEAFTVYSAEFRLVGIDATNGVLRRIRADIVAKRLGGGAILEGTTVISNIPTPAGAPATASNVANWAITANVSGNDFVITVTGAAGRTIDWLLSGIVESFTPGGS